MIYRVIFHPVIQGPYIVYSFSLATEFIFSFDSIFTDYHKYDAHPLNEQYNKNVRLRDIFLTWQA